MAQIKTEKHTRSKPTNKPKPTHNTVRTVHKRVHTIGALLRGRNDLLS